MSSPQEWYNSLPRVTRVYLTAALLATIGVSFNLISPFHLHLDWTLIVSSFQIWRLVTPFIFLGKFSLGFVFQIYILITYSVQLESNPFPSGGGSHMGTTADYLYMLLLGMAQLLLMGWLMATPFLGSSLIFMILYVWANRNPNAVVRMPLFGFQFKAVYLPWSMLAFGMLMGNSPVFDLMGIATGHVYYFLQDVLPNSEGAWGGKRLLFTPGFLSGLLGEQPTHLNARERMAAAQGRGPGGAAGAGGGHHWGGGRALGQG